MQIRPLGKSGLTTAKFAFGGNVFGWTADRETSFRLLDACVSAGVTLIDTADVYSAWVPGHTGGESETVIGAWLRARGPSVRDKVLIATKVAMAPNRSGLKGENIRAACEDSLRRLGVETIDLYQSHRDDPDTPMEETLQAYAGLIAEGKVRAIGASNFTAARLKAALDLSESLNLPRYETLQPQYNLYDRADFERDLQGLCLERQVGVIPYYGLASGFLTGKYRSEADFGKSVRGRRMGAYLTPRGLGILACLDTVAAELETNQAAVALAWLMAQPGLTAPIASATTVAQLEALFQALTLELRPDHLTRLNAASEEGG